MARPELDRYSSDILDDADYAVMTAEQKRLADLEIRQKEKEMGQFRGRGLALLRYAIGLIRIRVMGLEWMDLLCDWIEGN